MEISENSNQEQPLKEKMYTRPETERSRCFVALGPDEKLGTSVKPDRTMCVGLQLLMPSNIPMIFRNNSVERFE